MMNIKKSILPLCLLSTFAVALKVDVASAETLQTKNFRVKITRNCPEGYIACDNVKYVGKNLNTGDSIRLTGKTLHRSCADGVTPCQFIGYEFRNGNHLYRVTEDGELQVYKGKKLILQEKGTLTF
ncbi:hypothetical protein BC008_04530 [Mastigocoleus testarum BC008]|uniref:Uncharacterized protein n=2 Tax=Mastigocoleus TaxID=996924 RepID=A0A0V7ZYC2_9CYAN|nr:hypothetical protein BC008_04530 [Mastigocoleus testarum BC008]